MGQAVKKGAKRPEEHTTIGLVMKKSGEAPKDLLRTASRKVREAAKKAAKKAAKLAAKKAAEKAAVHAAKQGESKTDIKNAAKHAAKKAAKKAVTKEVAKAAKRVAKMEKKAAAGAKASLLKAKCAKRDWNDCTDDKDCDFDSHMNCVPKTTIVTTTSPPPGKVVGHTDCTKDDPEFISDSGGDCSEWEKRDCEAAESKYDLSAFSAQLLLCHCPKACKSQNVCSSNRCIESCNLPDKGATFPNNCAVKRPRLSLCNSNSQCTTGFCCPFFRMCLKSSRDVVLGSLFPPWIAKTGMKNVLFYHSVKTIRTCDYGRHNKKGKYDTVFPAVDGNVLKGCKNSYIFMTLLNEWASCPTFSGSAKPAVCVFKGDGKRPTTTLSLSLQFEYENFLSAVNITHGTVMIYTSSR